MNRGRTYCFFLSTAPLLCRHVRPRQVLRPALTIRPQLALSDYTLPFYRHPTIPFQRLHDDEPSIRWHFTHLIDAHAQSTANHDPPSESTLNRLKHPSRSSADNGNQWRCGMTRSRLPSDRDMAAISYTKVGPEARVFLLKTAAIARHVQSKPQAITHPELASWTQREWQANSTAASGSGTARAY
jgi:hypothetical protein